MRTPFLDLLERHFLELNPRTLRPAMKSIVLALLPGLEEETAEDFDRTLKLVESFKKAIRPQESDELTPTHSTGDDYFWQCFFLASITGQSRRPGALAYLVRSLPKLGHTLGQDSQELISTNGAESELSSKLAELVTTPEPGLLLRCFAAGLADEQLLIQRGFLDLLVTHLPLHSKVLQTRSKHDDLELLLKAAAGVVTRREMSLNRRLWTWLLGPEPSTGDPESGLASPMLSPTANLNGTLATRTSYFEEYGLEPLTKALLALIKDAPEASAAEKARPYRICLSLMDRWEIGGLVVPEVFLPIVDSVRSFNDRASSKLEFTEVLRSASTFFDGVESGLIYGEILGQMAQAIGPGDLSAHERSDKLSLVLFILKNFNIREEEMVTLHAPLTALAILCMIDDAGRREEGKPSKQDNDLVTDALGIAADLLEIVPERAFPAKTESSSSTNSNGSTDVPSLELLLKIRDFYIHDQGNLDVAKAPLSRREVGELLLQRACSLGCDGLVRKASVSDLSVKCRILMLLVTKAPQDTAFDNAQLLAALHTRAAEDSLRFITYSSVLSLATHLYSSGRIAYHDLSDLVSPLVRHAWSFLSASEPRYHVETVRSLWLLQTVLTPQNRDIEAALCALMGENDVNGTFSIRPAESGRSFGILWSHTLQDNPSNSDRRTPKTPVRELSSIPRLAGMENYEMMLTRPLFLMLDALLDEKTQLFMAVKTWLNNLVGIDK